MTRARFLKILACLPFAGALASRLEASRWAFELGELHDPEWFRQLGRVKMKSGRKYEWICGPFATESSPDPVYGRPQCVIYGQIRRLDETRETLQWAKGFPTKYAKRMLQHLEAMWPRAIDWLPGLRMTTVEERAFHAAGITRINAPGYEGYQP
jgi:hypothetical protein